jgi:hypothetical protein
VSLIEKKRPHRLVKISKKQTKNSWHYKLRSQSKKKKKKEELKNMEKNVRL